MPCPRPPRSLKSSRPKNIIPNTMKAIQEQIVLFYRIPYRSRAGQVKFVEIFIFCLQARKLLPRAQLANFQQMIIDVTESKIAFQTTRLTELQPWRARNIRLMLMLQEMAMRVLNEGQRCLREILQTYFAYEAERTGHQGRGAIQAGKVSKSLKYVRNVMEQQMPRYEGIQPQTQQGNLQEQIQVLTINQTVAQLRIQENVEEVEQARESQDLEKYEFLMDFNFFEDLMEGQKLAEIVLWDPLGPEMQFVTDFLEQRQAQEIEYEYLYNSTATQYLPAIEQAPIQDSTQ